MDQIGDALEDTILFQLLPLKTGVQRSGVGQPCEDSIISGENLVPLNYQLIYRNYERFLDFLLVQMSVRAFFIFPSILLIAAPDHLAIRVCAVPDLAAEGCAALAADQPVGENTLLPGFVRFCLRLRLHEPSDIMALSQQRGCHHGEITASA